MWTAEPKLDERKRLGALACWSSLSSAPGFSVSWKRRFGPAPRRRLGTI